MDDQTRVFARLEPWADGISLVMRRKGHVGLVSFQPIAEGEDTPLDAIVRLEMTEAQELMNELWRCGLRPSKAISSSGALEATKTHLEDMRKIAFEFLRPKIEIASPADQ